MKHLHLFTLITDALPAHGEHVQFVSTSKEGATHVGFGVFVLEDEWKRKNVFIGDGYHFIDSEDHFWNVTHWLDLSNLTPTYEPPCDHDHTEHVKIRCSKCQKCGYLVEVDI